MKRSQHWVPKITCTEDARRQQASSRAANRAKRVTIMDPGSYSPPDGQALRFHRANHRWRQLTLIAVAALGEALHCDESNRQVLKSASDSCTIGELMRSMLR